MGRQFDTPLFIHMSGMMVNFKHSYILEETVINSCISVTFGFLYLIRTLEYIYQIKPCFHMHLALCVLECSFSILFRVYHPLFQLSNDLHSLFISMLIMVIAYR